MFKEEETQQQTVWGEKKKHVTIVGAELYRGHGGEDEAFSERPQALSGIRP